MFFIQPNKNPNALRIKCSGKGTPIQPPSSVSRSSANDYLAPGVYTKTITAHPARINQHANAFHENMNRLYNDYQVIAVNTSPTPDSMIMYVTYSVGTPRN